MRRWMYVVLRVRLHLASCTLRSPPAGLPSIGRDRRSPQGSVSRHFPPPCRFSILRDIPAPLRTWGAFAGDRARVRASSAYAAVGPFIHAHSLVIALAPLPCVDRPAWKDFNGMLERRDCKQGHQEHARVTLDHVLFKLETAIRTCTVYLSACQSCCSTLCVPWR